MTPWFIKWSWKFFSLRVIQFVSLCSATVVFVATFSLHSSASRRCSSSPSSPSPSPTLGWQITCRFCSSWCSSCPSLELPSLWFLLTTPRKSSSSENIRTIMNIMIILDDYRKRYSRRATLEEQLLEGTNSSAISIGLPRITLRPRMPQVIVTVMATVIVMVLKTVIITLRPEMPQAKVKRVFWLQWCSVSWLKIFFVCLFSMFLSRTRWALTHLEELPVDQLLPIALAEKVSAIITFIHV